MSITEGPLPPPRLQSLTVRIDGVPITCQWFGRGQGVPVWIANWLDDAVHQAVYEANPGTLIEIRRN